MSVRNRSSLLDAAAEALAADPGASLADVAEAAGIGRTTLHKHYATRDDLLRAVGRRALDLWQEAVDQVCADAAEQPDSGLRALAAALIPIGPQLIFLWRTPAFDHHLEIDKGVHTMDERSLALLARVQARGLLAAGVPTWWLLQSFYSLVYVASESIQSGWLAPREAPDLVVTTFLHGNGAHPRPRTETDYE
jgi:AcrR family transcriptional regulator